MIPMLVTLLLGAVIVGIFLKNALSSLVLVALVLGVFFISCYAFGLNPRVFLTEGVHAARYEYRVNKREIDRCLRS